MRGDPFSEFDESCLFGNLFIPLFCGTRTPKKEKEKHLSTFQIYACNYFNSFTQIVNIESEITQQILELLDFFTVKRLNLALTA